MTHSLINKCAKNYYNRTFIVQVIAKNVVTCFFLRHSVYCIACEKSAHMDSIISSDVVVGFNPPDIIRRASFVSAEIR